MRGRAIVGAVAGLVAVAGCSGGGGARGAGPPEAFTAPAPAREPASAPVADEERAVAAAYLRFWAEVDRLVAAPDPADGAIDRVAVEPARGALRDDLAGRAARGDRTDATGPAKVRHAVQRVTLSGGAAQVVDCFVDGRVARHGDGTVDDAVVTKQVVASLVRAGREWKVQATEVRTRMPGVAQCAP